MIFYSAYIYGANFIAKFRRESGFLTGSMDPPPLGTNGSESRVLSGIFTPFQKRTSYLHVKPYLMCMEGHFLQPMDTLFISSTLIG